TGWWMAWRACAARNQSEFRSAQSRSAGGSDERDWPGGADSGGVQMIKHFLMPSVALLCAASVSASEPPAERAWLILQDGLNSKRAGQRANAVHALRILVHNS